jgi:hypothetical protein
VTVGEVTTPARVGPAETAAACTELHAGLAEQPATGSPLDTPLRDLAPMRGSGGSPTVTSTRSPNC